MRFSKKMFAAALTLTMLASGGAYCEEIKVGGGGASISSIFAPVKPYYEKATRDSLLILQGTSKDGLLDVTKGKVDITAGAVPLEVMLAAVAKDGITIDRSTLVCQEIGKNRTAVFVHPTNPVGKLSKDQLKAVFTGKITNWKDLGGDDKEIIVVWGTGTSGQNADFTRVILDGEKVTKDVMDSTNYARIKENIAATPEAIGIDPFGLADQTVKLLDTPEVAVPILAITLGKPSPKVQRLLAYIKGEGNKYVKH